MPAPAIAAPGAPRSLGETTLELLGPGATTVHPRLRGHVRAVVAKAAQDACASHLVAPIGADAFVVRVVADEHPQGVADDLERGDLRHEHDAFDLEVGLAGPSPSPATGGVGALPTWRWLRSYELTGLGDLTAVLGALVEQHVDSVSAGLPDGAGATPE